MAFLIDSNAGPQNAVIKLLNKNAMRINTAQINEKQ